MNTNISVVQGDTLRKYFALLDAQGDPLDELAVSAMWFTCAGLIICRKLDYDPAEGGWLLTLTSTETSMLPPVAASYDLTVEFSSGIVSTMVYKGNIKVLKKENPLERVS